MERDTIVDTLNDLIQVLEDSHLGLQQAAEDIGQEDLKALLNDLSARRAAMVRDLQSHVVAIGGAPEATGTLMGGARRMVQEIGVVLGARKESDILTDLVQVQERVAERFREIAALDLPAEVQTGLHEHIGRIEDDRSRLGAQASALKQADEATLSKENS